MYYLIQYYDTRPGDNHMTINITTVKICREKFTFFVGASFSLASRWRSSPPSSLPLGATPRGWC